MIIVGICGASGSGKSTLAKRIADSLACTCTIIGQDCYYRNFPELPLEKRVKLNYDEPEIFDFDEMYADVVKLQHGEAITTKGYDYTNYLRADSPDVLIQPPEVLILEGIHMFYDKRICDLMSLKVYLHVDVDVCLLRRIKRDIKVRGRAIDNIAEQYMETVKPVYERYIANYINDADFAVMRGGKNKMAIDAVSAYLTTKVLAERFGGDPKAASAQTKPVEPAADDLPESPDGPYANEKKPESSETELEGDDPFDLDSYTEKGSAEQKKNDGADAEDDTEDDEYTDEDSGSYSRTYYNRRRRRRRETANIFGFFFSSIFMNFCIAVFGLFMFGKVLAFDWTVLSAGGLTAMRDAGVEVFLLVLPVILTILFNRLLYKCFHLDEYYAPGLPALAIASIVLVQAAALYFILQYGFLGGAPFFGVASLIH
ncbi:MAG: uridine kinase [Clostridiaceae bacterium]